MKKLNKSFTILVRKTDIILLVSACFLTMLVTLNTMCSCVNSGGASGEKKCNKKTCDKKKCDKSKQREVEHISPNMHVDDIEGVNRSVFYENEMTL